MLRSVSEQQVAMDVFNTTGSTGSSSSRSSSSSSSRSWSNDDDDDDDEGDGFTFDLFTSDDDNNVATNSDKNDDDDTTTTTTTTTTAPYSSSSSSRGLPPLSDEEREELKRQCAEAIERIVSGGVADLEKLHRQWDARTSRDQKRLEDAMQLNHIIQERALDERMEQIIGGFLSRTRQERDKTHRLYREDEVERRAKAKEEEEKLKPKPLKPWDMTNNEYDQYDSWDNDWDW